MMQRSAFLSGAGAAFALAVGSTNRAVALASVGSAGSVGGDASTSAAFAPNLWLTIDTNEAITIVVARAEMGQGVATSLPMLVAEELEVPLDRVTVAFAPANAAYAKASGGEQQTGGSTSVAQSFDPLRKAGAQARMMLQSAAAARWNVPVAECTARNARIEHAATNQSASYGELAVAAAALPVPTDVTLKPRNAWTLIGKSTPRLDVRSKTNGTAQYGIDVRVPGMLIATVAKAPDVTGSHVLGYDKAAALRVPGVHAVVPVTSGIAVVADHYYAAQQGKAALKARFASGKSALSSADMMRDMHALAAKPGLLGHHTGTAKVEGAPGRTISATYVTPYLAHATMEPMNATAHVTADRCDVWVPTQVQTRTHAVAMQLSGLPADRVFVHSTLLGGGFGRRLETDFVRDALEVSKAVKRPVKVVWSREDDIQHDFYRPASVTAIEASLDANGRIGAMQQRVVSSSVLARFIPAAVPASGYDAVLGTGAERVHYAIPNYRYEQQRYEPGIPVGWLRAPYANANAWSTESAIDELAHLAGTDPYQFRRAHLAHDARALAVLDAAALLAGWKTAPPSGVHRGIAFAEWDNSLIATVADVKMVGGKPHVLRLASAVDCGTIVNPSTLQSQVRGAMVFGLSAAMSGKITFKKAAVEQHNFYDYDITRMAATPELMIHVMPSTAPPTGAGEIGTPPVAPAITNAIFAATGKRIRTLPISESFPA